MSRYAAFLVLLVAALVGLLLKFKAPQTGRWLPGLDNLVLRLTEGASIEGQVVDEKGLALPGVRVHIEDDFVLLSRNQGTAVRGPRQQFRPVLSNREGRFRFVGLLSGFWWPTVSGDDQIDNPAFSSVRVEPGEHKTGVRLLFQRR